MGAAHGILELPLGRFGVAVDLELDVSHDLAGKRRGASLSARPTR